MLSFEEALEADLIDFPETRKSSSNASKACGQNQTSDNGIYPLSLLPIYVYVLTILYFDVLVQKSCTWYHMLIPTVDERKLRCDNLYCSEKVMTIS